MSFQPHLFIDSGAFSAYFRNVVISLDEYIAFCHKLIKRYPLAQYINLDVIGEAKPSYVNWMEMRKQGLNPIPVFHLTSDAKWLTKYVDAAEYIALGGPKKILGQSGVRLVDSLWEHFLIDKKRMPRVKVHGLGYTSFPLMKRYPWFSLDSTSYLQSAIWGRILYPKKTKGAYDYSKPPASICISSQSSSIGKKGDHLENLNPIQRGEVLAYLDHMKIPMGVSEYENGHEIMIERGVANSFETRMKLNAIFFAQFLKTLPYPRPFKATGHKGFFQ